ncbi:unnamed protein product [Bemisia tabaci]|uniref:BESS domain-containing protein n=1 Tax=Bemisia tabaci TaxID=7038 RepID=A0A9P0ALY0_BEMTA|nr:unnamed protein product [Bemisia tabaci]
MSCDCKFARNGRSCKYNADLLKFLEHEAELRALAASLNGRRALRDDTAFRDLHDEAPLPRPRPAPTPAVGIGSPCWSPLSYICALVPDQPPATPSPSTPNNLFVYRQEASFFKSECAKPPPAKPTASASAEKCKPEEKTVSAVCPPCPPAASSSESSVESGSCSEDNWYDVNNCTWEEWENYCCGRSHPKSQPCPTGAPRKFWNRLKAIKLKPCRKRKRPKDCRRTKLKWCPFKILETITPKPGSCARLRDCQPSIATIDMSLQKRPARSNPCVPCQGPPPKEPSPCSSSSSTSSEDSWCKLYLENRKNWKRECKERKECKKPHRSRDRSRCERGRKWECSPQPCPQPCSTRSRLRDKARQLQQLSQSKILSRFNLPDCCPQPCPQPCPSRPEVTRSQHSQPCVHAPSTTDCGAVRRSSRDEDSLFLMSLLPCFKKMDHDRKMVLRCKVQNLVVRETLSPSMTQLAAAKRSQTKYEERPSPPTKRCRSEEQRRWSREYPKSDVGYDPRYEERSIRRQESDESYERRYPRRRHSYDRCEPRQREDRYQVLLKKESNDSCPVQRYKIGHSREAKSPEDRKEDLRWDSCNVTEQLNKHVDEMMKDRDPDSPERVRHQRQVKQEPASVPPPRKTSAPKEVKKEPVEKCPKRRRARRGRRPRRSSPSRSGRGLVLI